MFEIIDDEGIIESPFNNFDDALNKLNELLDNSEIEFHGDIKIIEVHYITR